MSLIFSILSVIWGHPWGRAVIIGSGLFIFGVVKGWGWAEAGRDAAIHRAVTARDTHWGQTIKRANDEHDREMQKALEASQRVVAVPTIPAERVRLCAGDNNCRR